MGKSISDEADHLDAMDPSPAAILRKLLIKISNQNLCVLKTREIHSFFVNNDRSMKLHIGTINIESHLDII
jgi:hypothetical protein